jgi:hypothetical protein
MDQPQQACHGKAAPGALDRWLPKGLLSSRGIRHGASRAIHAQCAMAMPLTFARATGLQGAAEALQEEGKAASRESGAGLTVGRRAAPSARQMRQMTAGGMARQNLSANKLHGSDGREDTLAPGGIAGLLTRANDGCWVHLGGPLGFEAAQHGGDTGDQRSPPAHVGSPGYFIQEIR